MCGLVGVIGEPSKRMVDVFRDMLTVDVLRGMDSTGIVAVDEKNYWLTVKELGVPHEGVFRSKEWDEIDSWRGYRDIRALLGHNRWATRGAVNPDNAHPFVHPPVILMHNGTVHNTYELIDWRNDDDRALKFDTDSELIAYKISEKGIAWTWEHIDGAAALAWWDEDKDTLSLIRNEDRPLKYAFSEGRKMMMYASETWMISAMAERNKIKLHENTVWSINPNYLFTFRWNEKKKIVTNTEKKLKPFERPEIDVSKTYTDWWRERDSMFPGTHKGDNEDPAKGDDEVFGQFRQGNVGSYSRMKNMTEEEFRKNYDKCVFCQESVKDEFEDCVIVDADTAVCNSCSTVAEMENIRILH